MAATPSNAVTQPGLSSAAAGGPLPNPSPQRRRVTAAFRMGRRGALRLGAAVALIAGWEVSTQVGLVDPFFFSSPSGIGAILAQQFSRGTIWRHLFVTLQEAMWGLALGFVVGAFLAWLATRSQSVADLLEPVLLLLNAVPRIVLAPIFVMWLGLGIQSKIAVSFFLVFVVIFFAVYAGIREVDRSLVERIQILGGSPWHVLREVYIPSVLSWVFSSLRVAVGFAFTGAIVGEFVGSSAGLGYLMNFATGSQNSALLMATVVLIMVFIAALFAALERVERRLMAWK